MHPPGRSTDKVDGTGMRAVDGAASLAECATVERAHDVADHRAGIGIFALALARRDVVLGDAVQVGDVTNDLICSHIALSFSLVV